MTNKNKVSLAAIDQTVLLNHTSSAEYYNKGGWVNWGIDNHYPNDLYDAYMDSPTLHTLVDGIAAYVGKSDQYDILRMAFQLVLYGGVAIQVFTKGETKYRILDWQYLRLSDDGKAYYSLKFGRNAKRSGTLVLDQFKEHASLYENDGTVLVIKAPSFQTYPIPAVGPALTAVKTEIQIGLYHFNNISNGFAGKLIVNFNNGVPNDTIKNEIERNFMSKFTGSDNAGSIMFSWNEDKDHSAEVIPINVDDDSSRFDTITSEIKQQIFTAFRTNPNIFGMPTEGTGFSGEEYEQTYALFMKTVVKPYQKVLADGFKKLGIEITFNNEEL